MNIILLGAPGAGKGTQAVFLADHFKLKLVGTGDMFRKAIAEGTDFGKKAEVFVKNGELVPDDIVIGIVNQGLNREDWEQGLLFDGFPRTVEQAKELNNVFKIKHKKADKVIFISVPDELLMQRLVNRWSCSSCGRIYGAEKSSKDACPACGGSLIKRADDTPETVKRRLAEYKEKTEPVLAYYTSKTNNFADIDGSLSKEEVTKKIIHVL